MSGEPGPDHGWFLAASDLVHPLEHPVAYGLRNEEPWLGGWQRNRSGTFGSLRINHGSLAGPFATVVTSYSFEALEPMDSIIDEIFTANGIDILLKPPTNVGSLRIGDELVVCDLVEFDDVFVYRAAVPEGFVTVASEGWDRPSELIAIADLSEAILRRQEHIKSMQ